MGAAECSPVQRSALLHLLRASQRPAHAWLHTMHDLENRLVGACRRSDVRLLDSLIMTVQLNIRKLLQVACSASAIGHETRHHLSTPLNRALGGAVPCRMDRLQSGTPAVAAVVNCHVNMQEEGCPDINIICERITVGGLPTRFEDQTRLPMGVSVNSTSYSAKLLQVGPGNNPFATILFIVQRAAAVFTTSL